MTPSGTPAPPAAQRLQTAPASLPQPVQASQTRPDTPARSAQRPFLRLRPNAGAPAPGVVSPSVAPAQPASHSQAAAPLAAAADDAVVLTRDLTKTFGKRTVVEGLNLVVPRGSV